MENYPPRDVYEMTEIFEDLLFMRTHKFAEREEGDPDVALNSKGCILLGSLGITGRIFRRWYQTTWGWDNPSRLFSGETPRMELAGRYEGLASGDAYLGVQLVKNEQDKFVVVPSLYDKEEIDKKHGIFNLGRSFLPVQAIARENFDLFPPPNYDPGFKFFVNMLEGIEREIEEFKVEKLTLDIEKRFWQIFWPDACITILLNCGLDLPHQKLVEMSSILRAMVDSAVRNQGSGPDNYISIDELFYNAWTIFRHFDNKLLAHDEMISKSKGYVSRLIKKSNGPYSLNVFYNFGNLFDELFLFPADRYFGALECVWIDQQNFLYDLMTSIDLLKNDLKPGRIDKNLTKEQKKFISETNIQESAEDIYRIWFAPPTYFRILPRFFKYF